MNGLLAAGLLLAVVLVLLAGLYGAGWVVRTARKPLRTHAFMSGVVPA